MKKRFFGFGFATLFFSQVLFASHSCIGTREPHTQNYYGITTCGNVVIKNIHVTGSLVTKNNATLQGNTVVTGSLTAHQTFFDNVEINNQYAQGIVWLKSGTVIKGKLIFNGKRGNVCLDGSSIIVGGIVNGNSRCYAR